MKLTASAADFARAVASTASAIQTSSNPALLSIHLSAEPGAARFTGSDGETAVFDTIRATVDRPGVCLLPADTVKEIAATLPTEGDVALECVDGKVTIATGESSWKIVTMDPDGYPELKMMPPGNDWATVDAAPLADACRKVAWALPIKDHRRVLLHVYLERYNGAFRITATDGKCLYRSPNLKADGMTEAPGVVVSKDVCALLGKYRGAVVKMRIGAESIALDLGGTIIASRLIEGKYPDCNSVIPRDVAEVVSFNPKVAAAAMKRAGIVTDEKSKSIIMDFKGNRCEVSSMRHDAGAFKGAFDCAVSTAAEVAFNGAFFLEMVRLFDESKPIRAMCKPGNFNAPFLFDQTGEGTFLLMPIKLAEARPVPVDPAE